ncbi:MAG: dephospho-CoA kinase [Caldilineaceae bacterium]|nr:dephospho-CoA kinase [Caldilineaceae bacterium]
MTNGPIIIGLTGNIATGKSTVLKLLAEKGAYVLDADKLAHESMQVGTHTYWAIVEQFGDAILQPDGKINRRALGQIVFNDPEALAQLESIVHPAVFDLARQELVTVMDGVIVLEAIKLLEAGHLVTLCDEVWVVTSSVETQMRRLQETRHMDEAEAKRRMAAQTSQAEKIQRADRVIANDGDLAALEAQLDAIWQDLQEKRNS